jgi:hypothetical protein
MHRRRVHLRAGQVLVVRVVPPHPGAEVTLTAERPLQLLFPASRVGDGGSPTYHAELTGHPPLRMPWPATGRFHVTILDGLAGPHRIVVPVTVWPSRRGLAVSVLLIFLSIVGLRWESALASSASAWDIIPAVWGDAPYLLGLLLLGVLAVILLRVAGWLTTLHDPGDDGG